MCENMAYLCRLCLKDSEFRFSLFTGNILHKIESLTSIKIIKDDKLPQTCCESCVANVYTTYKFQQCIIESDKTLREKLTVNESHIIEQAKQAPDLFEILHIDGPSYSSNVELVKVEPKIENVDVNFKSNYAEFDFKPQQAEMESNIADNQILSKMLQSSNCSENSDSTELYNKNDVKYIDVDNFVDTLKTLETSSDVDTLYSDLNMRENLELSSEKKCKFLDPIEINNINTINKELRIKEKLKNDVGVYKDTQKDGKSDDLAVSSSKAVLLKLGIQSKFDQKFAAYREKQKANQTELECPDCEKKFETKRSLQRHVIKHKIDSCPFCLITMRSDNLKRHIQIHTDSPEVCEICGKIAKNKESLRGHVNYQHKNTETVKCEACNREFKSNHHYKAHERKVHLGIRNHQCHICGKKFFANHDLNKHINMTHRGARPYICQYCKKGFSSPYARKTHIRQHTLETPYRCEICAAGFRQKVSLVTHLKSKHSIVTKKGDNTDNDNAEPIE